MVEKTKKSLKKTSSIFSQLKFFDAHTHVQFAAFKEDYKEVIKRTLGEGIGLINVGTQKDTSRWAVEMAHEFEKEPVYAAVGLHPTHAFPSYHDEKELGIMNNESGSTNLISSAEEFAYDYYKNLALDHKVVAIGECGLDYFRIKNNEEGVKEKQEQAFIKQMALAHEVKKPLMIHCRSAFSDLIQLLVTNYQLLVTPYPGIIHFFSGTKTDAKKLLEMGFFFTFGGVITFSRDYDEIVKFIPLDRILSETDAPYVTPEPYRGKRNEPSYVIEVVKKLAALKGVSLEKMAAQILTNVKTIFPTVDF